jgi:hypothetical protein
MPKWLDKGIELLGEVPGAGLEATRGCTVVYNARFFLRRGDEVTRDRQAIAMYRDRLPLRLVDDAELIDHETTLGKRRPIAAVEKTLYGMQADGYREVLASAHLCYGAAGVGDLIPPHAMLRIKLWVRSVKQGVR